jgi:hypothetical protein
LINAPSLITPSLRLDEDSDLCFPSFNGKIHKLRQTTQNATPIINISFSDSIKICAKRRSDNIGYVSTASGVSKVLLFYRNDSLWYNVSMTQSAEGIFSANIPLIPYQVTVECKIIAYDNLTQLQTTIKTIV